MTTNRDLAGEATAIAASAPRASIQRRGALCASVVLSTTSTPAAARRALTEATLPEPVRLAALEVLDDLAAAARNALPRTDQARYPGERELLTLANSPAAEEQQRTEELERVHEPEPVARWPMIGPPTREALGLGKPRRELHRG